MTSGDEPRWFIFRAVCGIGYASAPGKPTKLGRLGKYILQKFDIEPNRREKMLVLHRVCSQRGLYIHMAIELNFSYSIKERLYSGLVQPVANWAKGRMGWTEQARMSRRITEKSITDHTGSLGS